MGELGSIFEGEEPGDKPRGPDLKVSVEVPRNMLGRDAGFLAEVPVKLEHAGELVPRHIDADDEEGLGVRLFLSAEFRSGSTLRLRRQGGACQDGVPGDLFVTVEVAEPPPRPVPWGLVVVAVALSAGLVYAIVYAIG